MNGDDEGTYAVDENAVYVIAFGIAALMGFLIGVALTALVWWIT